MAWKRSSVRARSSPLRTPNPPGGVPIASVPEVGPERTGPSARLARAVEALGTGLVAHPRNGALRRALASGRIGAEAPFRLALHVALRLFFAFVLEDRGLAAPRARRGLWSAGDVRARAADRGAGEMGNADDLWRARATDPPPDTPRALALACVRDVAFLDGVRALALAQRGDRVEAIDFSALNARDPGGLYESLLSARAVVDPRSRRLTLHPGGAGRRKGGAYYTPPALVEHLLESALEPVVRARLEGAGARARERAVLETRVCDPACGSGVFLVAAAERLARHLARARAGTADEARALRDVIGRCLHGVDLDPIALEICRFALWVAWAEAGGGDGVRAGVASDGAWLDRNIRAGDALLGAGREIGRDARSLAEARRTADAWCASFFDPPGEGVPSRGRARRFFHWHLEFPDVWRREDEQGGGFDVIVGNPPFLSQLGRATASSRGAARLVRARTGGAVRGYADAAAGFLAVSASLLRRGGRAALVMPESILSSRDAGPVRRGVLESASLRGLWLAGERVFTDAGVRTCAPTIEARGPRRVRLQRSASARFLPLEPLELDNDELAREETWGHLTASVRGVPEFAFASGGTLGEIATATADFRDEYYGLAGFLVEGAEADPGGCGADVERAYPRVASSGLVDPGECRWGRSSARIHKRRWRAPRVDRARLEREGRLGSWVERRLVAKVLLATQTRVIEAYVDARGEYLPLTPLISLTAKERGILWRIGAAAGSPVCTALAMRKYGGAALSGDAIKLSACQAGLLPLPAGEGEWERGARALRAAQGAEEGERRACLVEFGEAMNRAYGVEGEAGADLMAWWMDRLPRRSGYAEGRRG